MPRWIEGAYTKQLGKRLSRLFQPLLVAPFEQLSNQQPFRRRDRFLAGEFRNRAIQRLGKLPEDQDRCVTDPGFQVSEMPLRHTGLSGQHLARHATARAQCSNALTQNAEEWIASSVGGGGSL